MTAAGGDTEGVVEKTQRGNVVEVTETPMGPCVGLRMSGDGACAGATAAGGKERN